GRSGGPGKNSTSPTYPIYPTYPAYRTYTFEASVRERAEKRRPRVRIAPLRAERGAGEGVLRGDANGRLVHLCERMEPLHRPARRVVGEVFVDLERRGSGRHLDFAAVIDEGDRRRRDLDDRADE